MKKFAELIAPLVLGTGLYLLLHFSGVLTLWNNMTTLAFTYLKLIPDVSAPYTSSSFEVVTSIIWDHRGFDTFFETSVLFMAILAALGVLGRMLEDEKQKYHTTLIPRIASRLLAPITVTVSVSIALHGHISPGGGFQGGVVFVIAPLMLMLAFSSSLILWLGFRNDRLIFLRGLALALIALAGLLPLLYAVISQSNAYLFQNLSKPDSQFSYPALIDLGLLRILLSGSLIVYNLLEYVAVFAGFTIALYLLERMFEEGGRSV